MIKVRIHMTNGQTLDMTWDASTARIHDTRDAFEHCSSTIESIEILRYLP